MLALMQTAPIPAGYDNDDARWAAVQRRDAAADGVFYYSVATTGVYCRPSCGARRASRGNVAFHDSIEAAERAGFRACKRCRPGQPSQAERHAEAVERACRLIETAEEIPTLDALADAAGLSRHHFHRLFKGLTGVTPKAYAAARRAERLRDELGRGEAVGRALYEAGYNAASRFYADAPARLGMAPKAFREGGRGADIRFAVGQTSLGAILVAATDKGVCAIQFGDDPDALVRGLQDRFPKAMLVGGDADFERLVATVVGYVEAPQALDLPLDVQGTAFQQRVWEALRKIPFGTTATYAEIAAAIGAPRAVRAVAGACAANAVALAIPCHRVVRSDGSLSGYRWGVERKRELLVREGAA